MKVSYSSLDEAGKRAIASRLALRKRLYLNALKGICLTKDPILLVGDRPGPAAPKEEGYHHTPFYSVKHCSGWLNTALHLESIPEEKLIWINSADAAGNPTRFDIVEAARPDVIIALGGNASKWLKKNGVEQFGYEHHPQYHKRFKNSERYHLLDVLRSLTA